MRNDNDVKVQNKFWVPRMVELTGVGNLEVDNGMPNKIYIDARHIALIYRTIGSWYSQEGENAGKQQPFVECTAVWLNGGGPTHINVIESPSEVALRRDRAMEVPVQLDGVD